MTGRVIHASGEGFGAARRWLVVRFDEPFLLHAAQRDVDRSALQPPARLVHELEAVLRARGDEEFEDDSLLGGECRQAFALHVTSLTNCKTPVKPPAFGSDLDFLVSGCTKKSRSDPNGIILDAV